MNPITGRTTVEVGGEVREIACDMNAGAILFERYGEHWTLWLLERFAGTPVTLPDGSKGRKLELVGPADAIAVLHALLATDRIDGKRVEDEASLRKVIGLRDLPLLEVAISRCVLVSFGVPGEAFEAAGGAEGPRGSARAGTDGTGTKP